MLYNILRFLFQLTVKGYFRSIYVTGKEHIPKTGPVIFAPNHPSAFMDPILLSTEINRKLFFLTRGDVFDKQIASALFRLVNMIPVYRKGETPDHKERNDNTFQKCFEHLAKGKALMIFPEGNSKTERRLRPLKTGTARVALGAELMSSFKSGVKIIPIGINYSNPHSFRSDVFINFGRPIEVLDYKELFLQDEHQGVNMLTERIKLELEKLLVIVQDEQLEELVRQIEKLYRSKLPEVTGPAEKGVQDFKLSKDIVLALSYHMRKNPERVELFKANIMTYLNGLKELNIRDAHVRVTNLNIDLIGSMVYFVLGMPLFFFGYTTNYLPYKVAGWVSSKISTPDDFVGSIKIAVGMFIFLIGYLLETLLVGTLTNVRWAFIFILSLYPAGVFTLSYSKRYFQVIGTLKYLRLFIQKSDLVAKLKVTRKQLIDELEAGKEEYLLHKDN